MIWSGASNNIPSGWVLCNGSNGTPDLRNRFVVGGGSSYSVGAQGGSSSVTLSTAQLPSHTHGDGSLTASNTSITGNVTKVSECYNVAGGATGVFSKYNTGNSPVTGSSSNSPTAGFSMDASHDHTFSGSGTSGNPSDRGTDTQGSSGTDKNLPPYYALCYIMKS